MLTPQCHCTQTLDEQFISTEERQEPVCTKEKLCLHELSFSFHSEPVEMDASYNLTMDYDYKWLRSTWRKVIRSIIDIV